MSIIDQFQKLEDLIIEHTKPPVQTMLRNQLALTREQVEAYQASSDKQDETLAAQIAEIGRLQQQNKALVAAQSGAEEERLHKGIGFRKSRTTGGQWVPFCPKCRLPVNDVVMANGNRWALCSTHCGWVGVPLEKDMASVVAEIQT